MFLKNHYGNSLVWSIVVFIISLNTGLYGQTTVTDNLSESVAFKNFTDTTLALNIEMVAIKGGSFNMGSNMAEKEQPIHTVSLRNYYIGKYEVTQRQWHIVMGYNPSKVVGDSLPVEQVSWKNVQLFLTRLNKLTGKNYSLPSEAQWEYAARAGTTTHFNTGNCLSTDDANYNGTSPLIGCEKGIYRRKEVPVGSFKPNNWGLYDVHGNVWEWCSDYYAEDYYKNSPAQDPKGPNSGSYKIIRGGGWGYFGAGCRSAYRGFYGPTLSFDDIGFRLVCIPE